METALSPAASAAAFRVLLDCMARPGRIDRLDGILGIEGLHDATMGIILALVDHAAPLHLEAELAMPAACDAIRFATGARLLAEPHEATFAITSGLHAKDMLPKLRQGSPEYPDNSTTLIVQCDALRQGPGVTLSGPGIEHTHHLDAEGLQDGFWSALNAINQAGFPLGIDVFLTAPGAVAAIARSTRIGVA
jgi:alpha-D-ribose 1-methylphosphonate 5-triphosphate synthase subunit PhnH